MAGKILLSTAYLPPIEYFASIKDAEEVSVETEENYHKQTYRNRCYILSPSGPHWLSVPVYSGSLHKIKIKDIRIDYSKRWQQVHLRAIRSSYGSSPFFQYYYDDFENTILKNYEFLLDLNMTLFEVILKILALEKSISFTSDFLPAGNKEYDIRYKISPKNNNGFATRKYMQVFSNENGFVPGLSIIDLIFNMGTDSKIYI